MQNSADLLEKIKGYQPQSGVGQLEDFLSSTIYLDFQNELLARIEHLRDAYEEATTRDFLETQGAIKALRVQASTIFTDLLENRKQDIEEDENG